MRPHESGAFADVFDLGVGRVLKAFVQARSSARPDADPNLVPQVSFHAELRAYEALSKLPELERYTPKFHRVADPDSFPLEGERTYSPGCGLILEKIPGEARKFSELEPELEERVEELVEQIQERVPLGHPWDGSCFEPGTRADFTIIDFATPADRLILLDSLLERYGRVPPEMRRALGLPEA